MTPEILLAIEDQNKNRKLWDGHDSPEHLAEMVKHEAQELIDAINESMVTGDVFSVVSEIGDVLYLSYRLCNDLGIDPREAVEMKIMRNSMKYGDYLMSNGRTYESATQVVKDGWNIMGGDKMWSHAYLDHLAHA